MDNTAGMFVKSNISDVQCPVCQKKLRVKPPCCNDKNAYYICGCGYKVKKEVTT